jgi:hypothetical protein
VGRRAGLDSEVVNIKIPVPTGNSNSGHAAHCLLTRLSEFFRNEELVNHLSNNQILNEYTSP